MLGANSNSATSILFARCSFIFLFRSQYTTTTMTMTAESATLMGITIASHGTPASPVMHGDVVVDVDDVVVVDDDDDNSRT